MNAKTLSECADAASEVTAKLSDRENAKDETIVRGLFLIASAISLLAASNYEVAAALNKETEGYRT